MVFKVLSFENYKKTRKKANMENYEKTMKNQKTTKKKIGQKSTEVFVF